MPRNSNGTYVLPSGNPVVGGTYITTAWANPTMEDIAAALTDSLSRSGQGGMSVPFKNADGNIVAPGISWTNESNTGFYRAASQDMRVSIGGFDKFRWTAAATQIWNGSAWSDVQTALTVATLLGGYALKAGDETISGTWTFSNATIAPGITHSTSIAFTIGTTVRGTYTSAGLNVIGALSKDGTAVALQTTSITGATSITGGGDLSADRTLSLVNDASSPGTSYYYGTDSGGTKGWFSLSSTGGVPEAPIDGTTYGRNNASWVAVGSGGSFLPLTGGTLTGPLIINDASNAAATLRVSSTRPAFSWQDTNAGTNAKLWESYASGNTWGLVTLTDAGAVGFNVLLVTRSSTSLASIVYGNTTDTGATHTFRGPVTTANGLTVTGAATVSTTLNVSGAATFTTLNTTSTSTNVFKGMIQIEGGQYLTVRDSANATGASLYNGGIGAEVLIFGKGALWGWDSNTLVRGKVSITTTAPTGNDAAKAGNIVLVY